MSSVAVALTLVLRIYDIGGVTHEEVVRAQHTTEEILSRAQIDLAWVMCQPAVGLATVARDRRCDEVAQPSDLVVRIAASPKRRMDMALGEAYVDRLAAFGSFATIYLDRVRSLAEDGGVDPGTLMGRAIAHEVGHLVSGTASHSATGVMRAIWSAAALRRDSPRAWTFSNREAAFLRTMLRGRVDVSPDGEIAALIEPIPPVPQPCTKRRTFACVETR